jgi:hypothetical protein
MKSLVSLNSNNDGSLNYRGVPLRENDINIQNYIKLDPPVFTQDTNWGSQDMDELK